MKQMFLQTLEKFLKFHNSKYTYYLWIILQNEFTKPFVNDFCSTVPPLNNKSSHKVQANF